MPPLSIIVDFEILEKRLPGLFMGRVNLIAYTLLFERSEDTLHRCVIPTIAFTRHTDHCPHMFKALLISLAGILTPAITMMEESHFGTAMRDGHIQSVFRKRLIATVRH